jgi:glutaminyl-tRNA synthetase
MPTLSGMRRRGYTPAAIRKLSERVGVAKRDGVVDVSLLEHALREDLNEHSPRVMAVLRPLKVVIENFPQDQVEAFEAPYFPGDSSRGTRTVPLSREIYIERDDFREDPPKKWFRLAPQREIRLRYACLITCQDVIKNEAGEVVELRCSWDPESRGGNAPDGRKVKGTSHWVSASHAIDAEVRLYDRLFAKENPLEDDDEAFMEHLNPTSLEVLTGCKVEPSLAGAKPGSSYQFERLGYFCVDLDSSKEGLIFNRTISLRDSWAKIEKKQKQKKK